jgi:hypothetical protein
VLIRQKWFDRIGVGLQHCHTKNRGARDFQRISNVVKILSVREWQGFHSLLQVLFIVKREPRKKAGELLLGFSSLSHATSHIRKVVLQ